MKNQLIDFLSILTCVILLFISGFILYNIIPNEASIPLAEIVRTYALPVDLFYQNRKNIGYTSFSTLLAPVFCGIGYLFFSWQADKEEKARLKLLAWVIPPLALFMLVGLTFLGLKYAIFDYVATSSFVQYPWIALVVNACLIALLLSKWRRLKEDQLRLLKRVGFFLYWGVGGAILVLIGIETIFNEAEPYVAYMHFTSHFDSVSQVFLGKHLLIDFAPIYGLYAWILKPIFQVIGLDVLRFTLVMGALKVFIYGSFLVLLYFLLENKLIAFLSYTTIVFYTRLMPLELTLNAGILPDPYFQFNPHRMLFPSIFLLLCWFYLYSPDPVKKRVIYYANFILSVLSIMWNPDTGLIVTIAWVGLLSYQTAYAYLHDKNSLATTFSQMIHHAVALALPFMLIFGRFTFSTYAETGVLPDLIHMGDSLHLFYLAGYFMLPMRIVDLWNTVVVIYLIGLYIPIRDLLYSTTDKQPGAKVRQPNPTACVFTGR